MSRLASAENLATGLAHTARSAGVVDGGQPLAERILRAQMRRVRVVVARACDGAPLVASAQRTAEAGAPDLVRALAAVAKAVGAERALVAVEHRAENAARALTAAGAEVVLVPDVAGCGEAHDLAADVAGLPVSPAADPIDHGVLVVDAETLCDLAAGTPVVDRMVTLAGAVARPGVCRVPIGTTIEDLVEHAGGATSGPAWIALDGGPVGGRPLDRDAPIGKGTRAIFVADASDPIVRRARLPLAESLRRAQSACEGCGQCTDVCPPHLLGGLLRPDALLRGRRDFDLAAALECTACGLCNLVCPVGLTPLALIGAAARAAFDQFGAHGPKPSPPSWSGPYPTLDPARGHRRLSLAIVALRLGLGERVGDPPRDSLPVTPARVVIPLAVAGGVAATPTVRPGDRVERGERIGTIAKDILGVPVHASIAGVVGEVTTAAIEITAVR